MRNRSVFGLFAALCLAVGAFRAPAEGQLGLPNIFGNAQNLAVNRALSEFGKSLGLQLPIVVADGDAYPSVPNLPGGPFRPGAPPANLLSKLRASKDGTVPLTAGDYSLGVNVFCMRISAHSPSAYRYLVAPLKGSAADIITALNERAPAMNIPHFPLQMLSWNIQGGLPYASMQPAQRAIVDRVIPEFRSRLAGDPLQSIRSKFDAISMIPGMPNFDGAMARLGPLGQSVITMESVRQQMLEPPASVAQMVRSFVPYAPPAGMTAPRGTTSWSKYSDRVYVRFVTAGGFADPGTYEVRVLPATVSVASTQNIAYRSIAQASPANVPMANIVNNPGTSSVQPLTQGPTGDGGNNPPPPTPPPTPSPSPTASISTQTVATSPSDRSRTLIGVGEHVDLTFSGSNATWSIAGGGGKLSGTTGKTNLLIAGDVAGSCSITAVDTSTHASASISFTIIPPSGIHNVRTPPDSMLHDAGYPDSGFQMKVYLTPDTVSFQNLEYREHQAYAIATGYFSPENGAGHDPKVGFTAVGADVPGLGSEVAETDEAASGKYDEPRPFKPGYVKWNIPVYYRVAGHTQEHAIATVLQMSDLESDGMTLNTVKGDASATVQINAP
jgi:hypothetical protein